MTRIDFECVRPGAGAASSPVGADTDELATRHQRGACAPEPPRALLRGFVIGVIAGAVFWVAVVLGAFAISAHADTASVFSIRSEPAIGCWPYSPSRLRAGYYVAHKTLPCGSRVRFCFRGRCVKATVRDRGPYIAGRTWDLDVRLQRALGFPFGVAPLRAVVLR